MTKHSFTRNDFKITEREVIYDGEIITVCKLHLKHKLFSGKWSSSFTREVVERFPASALLPYDPKLDRVILIQQFRVGALEDPVNPWQIEIPAGLLDSKESAKTVAIREAKEEASCDVTNVQLICDFYPSPGGSTEILYLFYGEVDADGIDGVHGLQDENEDIKVLNLSADEAFTLLGEGKIKTTPAIIALQWLQLNRERLRKKW